MTRMLWAAEALTILLAAASPADSRQDPAPPVPRDRREPADVSSTVELSFLTPVRDRILDPIGLARFQLSLESLLHGTLDDSVRGTSPLVKSAFFAGVLFLDRTIAKVGHEYGHISVFSRAGYDKFTMVVGRQDPQPLSFRKVFINALVPQRHMAVQLTPEDALDALGRFSGRDLEEFQAITYAGGLNQEQVHLNLYRERVLRHEFGFFDTSSYFVECLSTLVYSGSVNGDLDGYVDSLERAGVTSSIGRVRALSLVRFLSGSAVSAGIGFYWAMSEDVFDGAAPRVIGRPAGWTVMWPEFESYLTRRGPSVRASLPVRAGGLLVIPGLETAVADEGWEFEAGVEASHPATPWLDVRAALYAGTEGGTWLEAGVALKPDPALSLLFGWHAASGYTFRRDVFGETFDFESGSEWGIHLGASAKFHF